MLVVTRKQDESIVIGNEIEVMVLRIDRHAVRIGVRAPRHISVHRKEIFEEIKRENIAAAASQVVEITTLKKLIARPEKEDDAKRATAPGGEKSDEPKQE